MRNRLALVFLTVVAGCDQMEPPTTTAPPPPPTTPAPPPPPTPAPGAYSIQPAPATDHQQALTGTTLPTPLAVTVTRDGIPAAGVPVFWSTNSGSVSALYSTTDSGGRVRARWTLGSSVGIVTAAAWIADRPEVRTEVHAIAWEPLAVHVESHLEVVAGDSVTARVTVRSLHDGLRRSGVTTWWNVPGSPLDRPQVVTDARGEAELTFTPPTQAGDYNANVAVVGLAQGGNFTLEVVPGPVHSVTGAVYPQTILALPHITHAACAMAWDRFGNRVWGRTVRLAVDPGMLRLDNPGLYLEELEYSSCASISPIGPVGTTSISWMREDVSIPIATVDVVEATGIDVLLTTTRSQKYGFTSLRNGSYPAVDTVRAGESITWRLYPYDYDNHSLMFTPALASSISTGFPYGSTSSVTVVFSNPGQYLYRDVDPHSGYDWGFHGTVVVLP